MLHCAVSSLIPSLHPKKQKKFTPSLTEDINPQSSNWNNGKMKIACNSAYIQTNFNFSFAQKPAIVYCYIRLANRHGYCRSVITSPRVTATTCGDEAKTSEWLLRFCKFLVNPHFDLEPEYIVRKPIKDVSNNTLSVWKYCQLFTRV